MKRYRDYRYCWTATPNYRKRTFTIRHYECNGAGIYPKWQVIAKYRTVTLSKSEFEEMLNWTGNDFGDLVCRDMGNFIVKSTK